MSAYTYIWTPEMERRVLEALRTLATEDGKGPTSEQWTAQRPPGLPPMRTIRVRWGTWANALKAAGLRHPGKYGGRRPAGKGEHYWKPEELDELRRRVKEEIKRLAVGQRPPSITRYDALRADDLPTVSAVIQRFSCRWSDLCIEAGFVPRNAEQWGGTGAKKGDKFAPPDALGLCECGQPATIVVKIRVGEWGYLHTPLHLCGECYQLHLENEQWAVENGRRRPEVKREKRKPDDLAMDSDYFRRGRVVIRTR